MLVFVIMAIHAGVLNLPKVEIGPGCHWRFRSRLVGLGTGSVGV